VRGGGVGEVVGGDVDGLDGGDGPRRRVADALLEFGEVRGQRGLITQPGRKQAHEARHLLAGLDEAEDVVHHEEHVLPLVIPEVLGHGEGRVSDPEAGPRRLVHLSEDHDRVLEDPGLLHLAVELLALAAALPDAAEDADPLVAADDVVDQLGEQNRLADARAAEKPGFSAPLEGGENVEGLDPRLEDLRDGGLLRDRNGFPVDGPHVPRLRSGLIVDHLPEHVEDTAQEAPSDGHPEGLLRVQDGRPAGEPLGRGQGDAPGHLRVEMGRHFDPDPVVFACPQHVADLRQAVGKPDVDDASPDG